MDFDYVVIPALILLLAILVICLSIHRILSLGGKSYRMGRKVAELIALSFVVLLAIEVALSSSYNAVAIHSFRAHNPPAGSFYTVNGHRMHMVCTGSGSPTLVLDAGLGNDALIWGAVQPELSRTTQVCAYDRAGFGWSQAQPAPRDADHIAVELHELLAQAKVNGPIVLMGHSIAGLYLRDYAARYPAEVAGLVFVDASSPAQFDSASFKASRKGPPQWAGSYLVMRAAFIAGIPRLMGQCTRPMPGFDAHAALLLTEDMCHQQVGAMIAEVDSLQQSVRETVHTGPYGALPILVFSHDPARYLPRQNPPRWMVTGQDEWSRMQEDLAGLSTRGRRIVAKSSTHNIQLDRPDLLNKEVPLFIEQIRGTAPQPTNYGLTITE